MNHFLPNAVLQQCIDWVMELKCIHAGYLVFLVHLDRITAQLNLHLSCNKGSLDTASFTFYDLFLKFCNAKDNHNLVKKKDKTISSVIETIRPVGIKIAIIR